MFTSENRQGRLVEVRIRWPLAVDEVEPVAEKHYQMLERLPGLCVAIVDLSGSLVAPAPVAERLIALMGRVAHKIDRSAFLVPDSAILGMQVERAIEEGGGGSRRVFRNAEEMCAWLDEELDPAEQRRLQAFLREGLDL